MCGCVDVWMCGCADVQMCSCADVWMCGCADVQMCGCVDVWMCRCTVVRMCSNIGATVSLFIPPEGLCRSYEKFFLRRKYQGPGLRKILVLVRIHASPLLKSNVTKLKGLISNAEH